MRERENKSNYLSKNDSHIYIRTAYHTHSYTSSKETRRQETLD